MAVNGQSIQTVHAATRPEVQAAAADGRSGQILLQPVAPPSILGLYGFAGATLIVAANPAGWFGNAATPAYLFPFAAFFGGLAQFMAGMWSYRARDGLATAMHGMWGSFWMGYGVLNLLFAAGVLKPPVGAFPALGFWFIALAWITWMGAAAAWGVAKALFAVLGLLAAGSTIMAIAQLMGSASLTMVAGYVFVAAAIAAWYTASGLLFTTVYGRSILPLGQTARARRSPRINYGEGEPGVIHGQ